MTRYSDIVRTIKSNTLEKLVGYLITQSIGQLEGTTRIAYFFDGFVVKVNSDEDSDHNAAEYKHYCEYVTKQSQVPVVYTRLYKTTDNHTVLIQERLMHILEFVMKWKYREYAGTLYDKIGTHDGRSDDKHVAKTFNIPLDAFVDGAQCGYNKRKKLVFFDYSRTE